MSFSEVLSLIFCSKALSFFILLVSSSILLLTFKFGNISFFLLNILASKYPLQSLLGKQLGQSGQSPYRAETYCLYIGQTILQQRQLLHRYFDFVMSFVFIT